jgi:hypothetical protein
MFPAVGTSSIAGSLGRGRAPAKQPASEREISKDSLDDSALPTTDIADDGRP